MAAKVPLQLEARLASGETERRLTREGGYRVPVLIRWPGAIKAGSVFNDVFALEDMLPTLAAAAGMADAKERLLQGYQIGSRTYKVHLDGYNLLPYLRGETQQPPRHEFLYWSDDGGLVGLRYDRWKLVFAEQRAHSLDVWQDPPVTLRFPKLFDLRADPFERADHEGIDYERWRMERAFLLMPAQAYVGQWLQSFREFPPRQRPSSFNLDQLMQQLMEGGGGHR